VKSLQALWDEHDGRLVDKWAHYLPIYERYFSKFRGTACRILEIGVAHGGSLQLWKAYFGPDAWIVGVDIDPRAFNYREEQISIAIGDQGSAAFWAKWAIDCDIVIDDGSHVQTDQAASLAALWPHLNAGGVYLIEDIHEPREQTSLMQYMFGALQPKGMDHLGTYPWVLVATKSDVIQPQRIVTGRPSRPLNSDEQAVYGPLA